MVKSDRMWRVTAISCKVQILARAINNKIWESELGGLAKHYRDELKKASKEIKQLKEDLEDNQKLLEWLSGGVNEDKIPDDWWGKEGGVLLNGLKNNNLWLIGFWLFDKVIIIGLFLLLRSCEGL